MIFLFLRQNEIVAKIKYFNFLGMSKIPLLGQFGAALFIYVFYLRLVFLILVSRQEMSKKGSDQHFITKFGIYIYIIVYIGVA